MTTSKTRPALNGGDTDVVRDAGCRQDQPGVGEVPFPRHEPLGLWHAQPQHDPQVLRCRPGGREPPGGSGGVDAALGRFAAARDRVVGPLFEVVDQISGYGWDVPQLRRHLVELSSAMSQVLELIADPAAADEATG